MRRVPNCGTIDDGAILRAHCFCPEAGEQRAEALLSLNSDRRSPCHEVRPYWDSARSAGQLVMEFENGKVYVGSANLRFGRRGIVTCAHNFVLSDQVHGTFEYPTKVMFYLVRQGQHKYIHKTRVTAFKVHPGYFANPSIYSGCDLAIATLEEAPMFCAGGCGHGEVGFQTLPHPHILDRGVSVVGYPGEKSGMVYGMTGKVSLGSSRMTLIPHQAKADLLSQYRFLVTKRTRFTRSACMWVPLALRM